ncbi:MAG: hypothetical protein JWO76_2206 [Nocardioides sp.]|nr:hypothetical protein [Nocardioides sp.]
MAMPPHVRSNNTDAGPVGSSYPDSGRLFLGPGGSFGQPRRVRANSASSSAKCRSVAASSYIEVSDIE